MKHSKNLEQRTFLQDRFEILIKKQKKGEATFTELTELDDIVNKYASIREQILEEMHEPNPPSGDNAEDHLHYSHKQPVRILAMIKSFFGRVFTIGIIIPQLSIAG